jgi:hypothetical protein
MKCRWPEQSAAATAVLRQFEDINPTTWLLHNASHSSDT